MSKHLSIGPFMSAPFRILKTRNIWVIPPLSLLLIYLLPGLYGPFYFQTTLAFQFLGILALSLVSYVFGYRALEKYDGGSWASSQYRLNWVKMDWFIAVACLSYFAVFLFALFTSEKIAILEALRGADGETIAAARESMFKARSGPEKILAYLNAFCSSALMPYALAVSYLEKKKYRHILLILFLLSLAPSLEKTSVIKAFLPVIILGINRYIPWKETVLFSLLTFAYIFGTTKLTKAGHIRASDVMVAIENKVGGDSDIDLSWFFSKYGFENKPDVHRFELIDSGTPLGFIVNRAIWIPYITAYDWLVYFRVYLKDQLQTGSTSRTISTLTGRRHINMDQLVFAMQFSSGVVSTGSANAAYIVDAFVNFWWFGVIFFSLIIAAITRLVYLRDDPAMTACFVYYIYMLASGSLLGVLFSAGLLLFILMAFFLPFPKLRRN